MRCMMCMPHTCHVGSTKREEQGTAHVTQKVQRTSEPPLVYFSLQFPKCIFLLPVPRCTVHTLVLYHRCTLMYVCANVTQVTRNYPHLHITTHKSLPSKSTNMFPLGENKLVGEPNGFGVIMELGADVPSWLAHSNEPVKGLTKSMP